MWSSSKFWLPLELLVLSVKGSYDGAVHGLPYYNTSCTSAISSSAPTTIHSTTSSIIHHHNSSSSTSTTSAVPQYSSSTPETSSYNISTSNVATSTESSHFNTSVMSVPHYTTKWNSSIITSTATSTIISSVTYSITSHTASTSSQSCPTTCSISAGTVELFYWPTNNDYTYPSTYVDTALDYTFTSPSVYMVINTIYGYNSLGPAGPSATSPIFALNLDEVSTIVPGGSATRQLSLSDLGTDCPQTVDPSVLATMTPDGRCNPSLVAPSAVKSWALPCNACGKFGLFDPPYAIPSLDGGLIGTTTVVATTIEATTSASPVASATGVLTTATTAAGWTTTTSTDIATVSKNTGLDSSSITNTIASPTTINTEGTTIISDPGSTTTPVITASAPKVVGGMRCAIVALFMSACLLS